ncbi:MAG TPA: N-acetylmuramoyl-L-alanine amidase [Prolixibacteraceae bacterium]|nr:N-acetylmuramoyl-L-alanine amidase [Prolixibacteraceae bacterium]
MLTIGEKHLLKKGEKIRHRSCPKNRQKFAPGQPDTIVIHYTGGRDAETSAEYLSRDDVKASAHVVVDRDGGIIQLVAFDTVAWHAGLSEYNGRSGYNNFSIGIEIDNAGILSPSGDEFVSWFGKRYPPGETMKARHRNEQTERFWHTFTEAQIETTEKLCEILMQKYHSITEILGHEEIAVGRKQDPGPAFPLDKLRMRLIEGRETNEPLPAHVGFVNVNRLNIRTLPTVESDTVTEPLAYDTKLLLCQKYQNWYKVKTEIEGWVAADYIRTET